MGSRNIRMSIFSRIHRIRPRKTKYPTYKNLTVTTTRVIILNFQCVLRSSVLSSVCTTYLFNKDNKRLHFYLSIFKLCILYSSSSTAKFFVLFLQFLDILLKTYFQGFLGVCSLLRQILSSNSITIGICPYGV